ncbi:hypothetical protein D3C80_1254910 [compost metagenome]
MRIHLDHGQVVQPLVDDRQVPTLHHRHPFRVVPAVQRDLAQHIAVQAQLDQERVLAHDGEQGAGLRVEGDVRGFVIVHARQRFGVDIDLVGRQPHALALLGRAFKAFLDPQCPAVVPVHGHGDAIADDRSNCQAKGPAQVEASLGLCRNGGAGRQCHAELSWVNGRRFAHYPDAV